MANTLPDDLIEAYRNDLFVYNALQPYVHGNVDLVTCLVVAAAAMYGRHKTMIEQLARCHAEKKPYWAGDSWMPPAEGER